MNSKDGSFAPSEWAIVHHANLATQWEYVLLQKYRSPFIRSVGMQETLQSLAHLPANHQYEGLCSAYSNIWKCPTTQARPCSFRVLRPSICSMLLAKVCAQLVFLLFGQIGLDDLELLPLDCFSYLFDHSSTRQQEQG